MGLGIRQGKTSSKPGELSRFHLRNTDLCYETCFSNS